MGIMDELAQMPVQRKTYFVQAENAFLRNSAYTSNEIRVFLILCTYAGVKAHCFPGQNGIAKHMGISRNRVNQILKDLEKKNGVFILNTKGKNNSKGNNIYFLAEIDKHTGFFIPESLSEYKRKYNNF